MKFPTTLAISSLILLPLLNTAQSVQTNPCLSDSMRTFYLGGGFSAYSVIGGYGGHLQVGYPVGKRFIAELKAVYTGNNWEDYTLPADGSGPGARVDYHSGQVFTVSLGTLGYFIGSRQPEGKGGVYAGAGLGYTSWKMASDVAGLVPVTDSNYYKYRKDFGNRDFSASLSLGGDRKIGTGRIYVELLYSFAITGTEYANYQFEKQPSGGYLYNLNRSGFRDFESFAFVNLGYRHTLDIKKRKGGKRS